MTSERWLVLAAGSRDAAVAFARRHDADPVVVLTRSELGATPWRWRRAAGGRPVDRAIVHSLDWSRQAAPQLFELALAAVPAPLRSIADEATGRMVDVGPAPLARATVRAGRDLGVGLRGAASEIRRFRRQPASSKQRSASGDPPQSVLAIWIGEPRVAGGAISHITGILAGFREHGLRVGLVTTAPPPEQLAAVVDDVEVAVAPPPGSRAVIELQRLADNAGVRDAALRIASRRKPDFVYQRHRPLFVVGPDVAAAAGVPLVLEWNASEQWKRRHWEPRGPLDWLFDGLVARMEEATLLRSDLVVAVSRRAADMAVEYGAPAERVITVPNAVRFDQRPPDAAPDPSRNGAATVGWIGTFGPWHGAEVLISALPRMGPGVRLRMIGDGTGRDGCRRLAQELGVDERIEWTGALPHPDALAALARCDVLASPHLTLPDRPFFGSPMKIFEYMALGRPIVASRLEQLDEILDDGRTARLVTPGDVAELAEAIEQVLAAPDRGESLGRAALEEARREHTWAQRAESVLRALEA